VVSSKKEERKKETEGLLAFSGGEPLKTFRRGADPEENSGQDLPRKDPRDSG